MENKTGRTSRKKNMLIKEAIQLSPVEDRFNKFKLCEKVAELMVEQYSGGNLDYHSERMGMDTNKKIMSEIEKFFYRLDCDTIC